MELNTCVWNACFFVLCYITEVKKKKKELCLFQLGNQNVYDTLDTNGCSVDVLTVNGYIKKYYYTFEHFYPLSVIPLVFR